MLINREAIGQNLGSFHSGILLPIAVGLICGLEAILIKAIIPTTFHRAMTVASLNQVLTVPVILALLLGGGFLISLLTAREKGISGVGLDVAIESYHLKAGLMSSKFPPLKFLATLFTIGFGGSGGLVGPTAIIGQGTASYFSRWARLPQDRSRTIALCGIAACVSGLLRTPFGAAIFALELCYVGSLVYENLISVVLASISSYIMSAWIAPKLPFGYMFEQSHLFRTIVSDSAFPWSLHHLAYCVIAALITAFLGIFFIKSFLSFQEFIKEKINTDFRPVIGFALTGLIAALFFRDRLADVLGDPSGLIERSATTGYPMKLAIILLVSRGLTTFLTIGFGGSGGLFSPTVLMGSLCGIIVGDILGVPDSRVLVTTGIAAALSGVMNVPMAAVIIVVEVFGVNFIIPAAIGSAIAFPLAQKWVIYPHVRRVRLP